MTPRSHANRGRWFQALIDAACAQYRLDRKAYIFPVATPVRFDRRRGGRLGSAFFARKSSPDYLGFLATDTGVAFDAKSTAQQAWSAQIPAHQIEALQLAFELGHVSGIMLGFWEASPVTVWVPFPSCQRLWEGGAWTKTRALGLPGAVGIAFTGMIDFLPALEQVAKGAR